MNCLGRIGLRESTVAMRIRCGCVVPCTNTALHARFSRARGGVSVWSRMQTHTAASPALPPPHPNRPPIPDSGPGGGMSVCPPVCSAQERILPLGPKDSGEGTGRQTSPRIPVPLGIQGNVRTPTGSTDSIDSASGFEKTMTHLLVRCPSPPWCGQLRGGHPGTGAILALNSSLKRV